MGEGWGLRARVSVCIGRAFARANVSTYRCVRAGACVVLCVCVCACVCVCVANDTRNMNVNVQIQGLFCGHVSRELWSSMQTWS